MRKKVTVLFPVYKEKIEMIELALDSILNQTMKDFILRIRLDDPDNLEAEEYLRRKKNEDNRIEFEVNSQNFGLPKTLNLMMDDIETKYVARMDADDISLKNRLEEQYQFMESHHDVDLCGTNIVFIDSNGNGKTYDNTKKIFGKQNNLPHFSYNIRISKTNWPTVKITNLSISFKPNDKMIKKASVNKNKIIFLLTLYTI